MTSEAEVLEMLEKLTGIFEKEPADVDGYLWVLADFPDGITKQLRRELVARFTFFPRPAEVRKVAQEIGEGSYTAPEYNPFTLEFYRLQNLFYHQAILDAPRLGELIEALERSASRDRAAYYRQKLAAWLGITEAPRNDGQPWQVIQAQDAGSPASSGDVGQGCAQAVAVPGRGRSVTGPGYGSSLAGPVTGSGNAGRRIGSGSQQLSEVSR